MDHLTSQRRRRITERGIAGAVHGCFNQHDYSLANQAGAGFRSDANDALAAVVSLNSGATAPATTFAYMLWADTTTGLLKQRNAANTGWITILTLGQVVDKFCEGRLTLTSGTAVTTGDVTAAETVYFTPFRGNKISLYNGTDWKNWTFTELSVDVPDATQMNDVFIYDNSGTLTLETVAWTNDTTRATALVLQDGIYVKSGSTGKRYLGSFYATTAGNGQTEDSFAKRWLWNYYNRVARPMAAIEATSTWTYTTATYRQANGAAANQLDFVVGVAENDVRAEVTVACTNASAGVAIAVGIGLDSTTVNSATRFARKEAGNTWTGDAQAEYLGIPSAGRHTLVWLEYSAPSGTTTWSGASGAVTTKSGISGELQA